MRNLARCIDRCTDTWHTMGMTTTAVATEAVIYLGRCHECRTVIRTTEVRNRDWYNGKARGSALCPTCPRGQYTSVFGIRARITTKPCAKRCINATGIDCDCSCGGRAHGSAHA